MNTHLCSDAAESSSAHRFDGALPVIPGSSGEGRQQLIDDLTNWPRNSP
jgi:hypothetical protein